MMFDEAYQSEKETQERLAKIDQAQAELAERVYEFEVPQWGISATVDGFGALLDLVIPPGTTARRDAPAMLGRVITDTILGARRRVALDNKDMITGIMGKSAGQQLIGTSPLDGLIAQYEEYEAAKEQEPPDVSFVDNTPPPQRPEPTPAPPPAPPAAPRHEPAHASREAQSDDDFFEDLNEGGLYQ